MQLKDTPFQLVSEIKSDVVGYGQVGYSYDILTYDNTVTAFPTGSFKGKMCFLAAEIDPSSKVEQGSYPDEYALPDIKLSAKDYIKGKIFSLSEFK